MTFRWLLSLGRWAGFAVYLAMFFSVPLGLLWNLTGLWVGVAATVLTLCGLRLGASSRIARRLAVQPLSAAQAPKIYSIVREYCRRLDIPTPRIGVLESPALNAAVFGFSKRNYSLVLTRGLVNTLSRDQLASVIGRKLSYLWYPDVINESWLCGYLAALNRLLVQPEANDRSQRPTHSSRWLLQQVVFYPLALIPTLLLMSRRNASDLDLKSAKLTRKPREFADSLRLIEALQQRVPVHVPLSTRHLFLLPPPPLDPLGRVLLANVDFSQRILSLARLVRSVNSGPVIRT